MSHSSQNQLAHPPHSSKEPEGQVAGLTGDGANHLGEPSPTDDDGHQYPPLRRAILITVALGLSTFCVALDNTVLATAIPKICEEFDSLKDMSWYASSYLLVCSTFMLSFGRMYTLYPSKWIYLTALALFELGSLVSGATPTSIGLILGRAIAGIGAAGLLPGPMIILSELVPLRQRPTLIAVIAVLPALAVVCGPMIGGVLTERVTWRLCFYINLPLGAFTAVALLIFLPVTNRYKSDRSSIRHFDWIGMATLISGIVSLLLALQWGGSKYHWTNARIIVLLVLAGVLSIIWVGVQHWKQEDATVPLRLLKHRNLLGVVLYAACVSGAFTVLMYYLPIWFQAVKGSSPSMSGVMNVPMVLGMIIVSFLAAWLIMILGYLTPFLVLGTVVTAIGVGLCSNFQTNSGSAQWIGYQAIVGMGFGLAYSLPPLAAQAAVRPEDVSLATTLVTFMQNVAGAILVTAAQDIFQSRLVINLSHQAPEIDSRRIIQDGVTDLSKHVDHELLPSVLSAYNLSITQTLYLAVAATSLSLVGGLIMHPKLSIKTKSDSEISQNDEPQAEKVDYVLARETRGDD